MSAVQPTIRTFLCDEDGTRFFGAGPCRLLRGVERTGSLNAAAAEMKMAYTKALAPVRAVEKALGAPNICRTIGGKGGGGSRLTPQAKELIERYERYEAACAEANRTIFEACFCGFGQAASSADGQPPKREDDAAR